MKILRRSFRSKLWGYFALFAVAVLAILWIVQTLFLQVFYEGAVKDGIRQAASTIEQSWTTDDPTAFTDTIDAVAGDKSLLVLVTDWDGSVLYSADEHSIAYRYSHDQSGQSQGKGQGQGQGQGRNRATAESENTSSSASEAGDSASASTASDGSSESTEGKGGGKKRFLELTRGFSEFLERLKENPNEAVESQDQDGSLYAYGIALSTTGEPGSACSQASSGAVLYLSTTLQPVGATATVMQMQLVIASAIALLLAFALAFALSRGFSKPVEALTQKAERLADAQAGTTAIAPEEQKDDFKEGFCSELDDLALAMDEASAELAQVEVRRREFLANISHDLRTPLTLIKGYAEAARDDAAEDDEMLQEDLGVIVRETDRLSRLVNEILDYSSFKDVAASIQVVSFDASAAFGSVAETFASFCERDGLKLDVSIEPNVIALGEEQSLVRVAFNLIDNAVSHSPGGCTVGVLLATHDNVARFEVRDQGEGIPAEEIVHVWDRYFTKKQAKRNSRGSGLGLAISKEILEAHHARYGVESTLGEGSTFWFELPIVEAL